MSFVFREISPKYILCTGEEESEKAFIDKLKSGYLYGIPVIQSCVYKKPPEVYFEGYDWCPMRGSKRAITLTRKDDRKHAYAYHVAYLVGKRIAKSGKRSAALKGKSATLWSSFAPSFIRAIESSIQRGYMDNVCDEIKKEMQENNRHYPWVELKGQHNGKTRVYLATDTGLATKIMGDVMRLDEQLCTT